MATDTTSTPITAEGLRGLGMDYDGGSMWYFSIDGYGCRFLAVWVPKNEDEWRVYYNGSRLGTAPDLEWVESMIGLLQRANGGEGKHGNRARCGVR